MIMLLIYLYLVRDFSRLVQHFLEKEEDGKLEVIFGLGSFDDRTVIVGRYPINLSYSPSTIL